jgi:23S rRNA (adenine2503-C2)-methyltransferase
MSKKNNLLGLTREELQDYLIKINEKPYRGLQIFEWIHNKGIIDFDSMTNLGKDLIEKLKQNSIIEIPEIIDISTSSEGTKKFLLKLDEDSFIEMVKIPEKKRQTLCISSQAGCAFEVYFLRYGLSWI